MASSKEKILQVRELIKSGKRKQAVALLTVMIERDHNNPELWWLLANAAQDPHQIRMALDELLVLRPDDERAKKMLDRVETRQLLNQMGFKREQQRFSRNPRVMIYAGVTAVVVMVVLVVALVAVANRGSDNEVAQALPTSFEFPTATDIPPSVTPLPTEEPTLEPAAPTAEAPQLAAPNTDAQNTGESVPQTIPPEETQDPAPQGEPQTGGLEVVPTSDFSVVPGPEFTLEVLPPGDSDTSASLAVPTTQSLEQRLDDFRSQSGGATTISPESTAEVTAPDTGTQGLGAPLTVTTGTPAIAPSPTPKPVTVRGQLIEREPRQELIPPYGEHGWTFSGYRDEQITIDLINITGRGNPSLELRNARDEIIASDIDILSGKNNDANISLRLPADGIYTVVVRMAAVDEQLYYLLLKRG